MHSKCSLPLCSVSVWALPGLLFPGFSVPSISIALSSTLALCVFRREFLIAEYSRGSRERNRDDCVATRRVPCSYCFYCIYIVIV